LSPEFHTNFWQGKGYKAYKTLHVCKLQLSEYFIHEISEILFQWHNNCLA